MTSHDELDHLKDFLRNEPLNKITVAKAFHELWKYKDIQSEGRDCNCLLEVFKELTAENLNSQRKRHLTSLQDIDKMRCIWVELKSLMDEDLIRLETNESSSWKLHALCNINSLKDALQQAGTPVHHRLLQKIQELDINDLTYDNPLANGIVDLGSSQYQLTDDDYEILAGEKCTIRKLKKGYLIKSACANYVMRRNEIQTQYKFVVAPSETTRHKNWVVSEIDRAQIATNITDTLLQEMKRNVLHKISKASEHALVDVVARLIEASIYQMPIGLDIEVTRNDRQSDASKKRKNRQVSGSRGTSQT
ncbi:3026_t:CDS:2 [Paraglomus occultum]|uniref:3026_t:CDS:1 n=1 Tax=Paraglomus occultum TaxID=144539 RepID=A0A9N9CFV1_9GLOM|nr:3026_t:CDS:2 [Paraglomus occultum]